MTAAWRPPRLAARAVVFDLDGTLLDSAGGIAASVNHARLSLGLAALPPEEVRGHIGWGLERLLRGLFPPAQVDAARGLYRDHYGRTCLETTTVLPGAHETLAELARRGLRTGVATNKPSAFTRALLEGLGLAAHLGVVLGADEVRHPKPHPEMLGAALARLGVEPGEALYVGDMHVDAETARAAGVRAVLVATGAEPRARLEGLGAGAVIDRLDELLELLA